jgi:hypothetical protein
VLPASYNFSALEFSVKITPRKIYAPLVVGSRTSGGWVAEELTESGLPVVMLEQARRAFPLTIPRSTCGLTRCASAASATRRKCSLASQPVQRLCYAGCEYSHQFFVDGNKHPFPGDKPFMWIRGRQLGGQTYYDCVESYIDVSASHERLPQMRDGKLLAHEFSRVEVLARPVIEKEIRLALHDGPRSQSNGAA